MDDTEQQIRRFLLTISRPGTDALTIPADENMVRAGLIDSLAVIQIVLYIEEAYSIDFSLTPFVPEHFTTIANICKVVDERA